jgi:hypothetical protein
MIAFVTAVSASLATFWKLWSLFVESKRKGWVTDTRALSNKISEAETDEERAALAKSLFDHRA